MASETDRMFAASLLRLRTEHGWTQRQLADRAGVSAPLVSVVERGIQGASLWSAKAIADGLGVPLGSMIGETGNG